VKRLIALVALLLLITLGFNSVSAQNKKSGGITISPASQEIVLDKDEKTLSGSFTVTNNNDTPETFMLSTVDMGALDETGGLVFSGLPQDYQEKYGLAKWISLSRTSVTVKPKTKEAIDFTIKNEALLSPGGHYGAVIVRRAEDKTPLSDQRISLSPQAASLIFLRKVGGEVYGLSLPHVTSNHSIWRLPTKVDLPFKNDGNVHVVPRGIVRLKNTFGDEIAKSIINPESSIVLPERSRTLHVAFDNLPRTIWPGRYHLEVEYRYDGQEHPTYLSQTFYTANLRVLLLLVGLLLALLLAGYKLRRRIWRLVIRLCRLAAKPFRKLSKQKPS
jgi:hypothetical protein